MAGPINLRASPGHSPSLHSLSSVQLPSASKVAVQFGNPVFCSRKLCLARSLTAAALKAFQSFFLILPCYAAAGQFSSESSHDVVMFRGLLLACCFQRLLRPCARPMQYVSMLIARSAWMRALTSLPISVGQAKLLPSGQQSKCFNV
jgi:hypothetical protein